jgi:hypothetical protein
VTGDITLLLKLAFTKSNQPLSEVSGCRVCECQAACMARADAQFFSFILSSCSPKVSLLKTILVDCR